MWKKTLENIQEALFLLAMLPLCFLMCLVYDEDAEEC